jgi:hypothetical protein
MRPRKHEKPLRKVEAIRNVCGMKDGKIVYGHLNEITENTGFAQGWYVNFSYKALVSSLLH